MQALVKLDIIFVHHSVLEIRGCVSNTQVGDILSLGMKCR